MMNPSLHLPHLCLLLSIGLAAAHPRAQGPMVGGDIEVVQQFDKNGDKRLDADERKAARAWLKTNRPQRGGRGGGPGGPGGFGGPPGFGGPGGPPGFGGEPPADAATKQGRKVEVGDAKTYPDRPFYDLDVVRTLFVTFPQSDWFEELGDFYRTDVNVPATLVVDGKTYSGVGVHFRGNTSYQMVRGKKKSLHISFDHEQPDQRVYGYRSTNLINGNEDQSGIREALNSFIANRHAPSLQANLVRLVVNGEDFGVYVNLQHFNKDFLDENWHTSKGARFKIPPDFSGGGALRDLGDDEADYRRNYVLKSDEDPKAWTRLKDLCQLLEHGEDAEIITSLPDYLDIDDALWFLAIDNAILDGDGYYSRGSDYALWLDSKGRFHPVARDGNEVLGSGEGGPGGRGGRGMRGGRGGRGGDAGGPGGGFGVPPDGPPPEGRGRGGDPGIPGGGFGGPGGPGGGLGGPGGRGGPRSPGVTQGALAMIEDPTRPLIRRLLSVPQWRERYLWYLHTISAETLNPTVIVPRLAAWQALAGDFIKADVHSLYGYDAFVRATTPEPAPAEGATAPATTNRSIPAMIAARRKALLADPALQGPWPTIAEPRGALTGTADHFRLKVTAQAKDAARMRLHIATGKVSAYRVVPMYDDGQHDDGAAGDFVFGATSEELGKDRTVRWFVEASLASGRTACAPASGGSRPAVLQQPEAPAGATKSGKDKK